MRQGGFSFIIASLIKMIAKPFKSKKIKETALKDISRRILIFSTVSMFIGLSACAPIATGANLPTSTVVLATWTPAQIPVSPTPILATEAPGTAIPTAQPSTTETEVIYGSLSFVVPPGVASGASGREYPRVEGEDAAWWQKTPGHLQVTLGDYYVLQGKFHQPQIYVYPAQEYAELVPPAFESLHRLNNILGMPGGLLEADQLPAVPFFNAQPVFTSNIKTLSFLNGGGVRFLTEYAQYAAPVNNYELFYHFQGVTRDGAYYIIAVFPITAPVLAETSDAAAARAQWRRRLSRHHRSQRGFGRATTPRSPTC